MKKLTNFGALATIKFEGLEPSTDSPDEIEEVPFEKQYLEAHFSNKGRAGKTVTLIKGFEGSPQDLKTLSQKLKQHLGVGGTIKNNEILIQGNYRDKIMDYLHSLGHEVKRVGG